MIIVKVDEYMIIFSLLLGLVGAAVFLTISRVTSKTESQTLEHRFSIQDRGEKNRLFRRDVAMQRLYSQR
ncbi:hypothetical protein [Nostoc sp. MG11]|uniref:hypothetical protein n=1 Tax=Nostoc sp. MG11 TaxID=2721166 RepID=UPI001865D9BA|nr:hypothetical protein [Nostoc sp. MG11]